MAIQLRDSAGLSPASPCELAQHHAGKHPLSQTNEADAACGRSRSVALQVSDVNLAPVPFQPLARTSAQCYKAATGGIAGTSGGTRVELTQAFELGIVAAAAAIVGSMLGLGGGVFLVPIFTLFFGVDQKLAIGASAVAVVTNSVVGSTVHLRSGFTNLRLAMLLQVTMASGALIGALTSVFAPERIINAIFGAVLLYAAVSMALRRQAVPTNTNRPDPWGLGARYYDPAARRTVRYVPERVGLGLGISGVAGVISGMLGVGGGVIQVPAMNLLMRVPVKAAAGTSAFMVGITSVATAFVFYAEEKMDPRIVVPAIIGIFAGSQAGSRLTRRVRTHRLVLVFVLVLLYLGGSLLLKAAGITVPGQR